MSTAVRISIEEYLKLNGKPAYEYVDGVLRQKPRPTTDHGLIQAALILLLAMRAPQFAAMPEVHRDAAEWTKLSADDVLSAGELELPLQDVFRDLT